MAQTDTIADSTYAKDVMDEAFSKVHVSTEVTNLYLNVSIVPQSNQTRKSILIGDTIQVMCSYDNPEFVNPAPNMRILMVRRENGEEGDEDEEGEERGERREERGKRIKGTGVTSCRAGSCPRACSGTPQWSRAPAVSRAWPASTSCFRAGCP